MGFTNQFCFISMRISCLLVFFSLTSLSIWGQTTFSIVDNIGDKLIIPYGVVELNDEYIIGGFNKVIDTLFHSVFFAKYDLKGNFIERVIHRDTNHIITFEHNNDIEIYDEKLIWNGTGSGRIRRVQYDPKENNIFFLDTFNRADYSNFGSGNFLFNGIDSSYVFCGGVYNDQSCHFSMLKINSDTFKLFEQPLLSNWQSKGFKVFLTPNNTYKSISAHPFKVDQDGLPHWVTRISEFDTNLNLLEIIDGEELKEIGPTEDAFMDENENIFYCSNKFIKVAEFTFEYTPYVSMINKDGSIHWETILGIPASTHLDSRWHCITAAHNNEGAVVGGAQINATEDSEFGYAVLAKVSEQGDSIWYRRFSNLDDPYAHHQFNDVIATSDGGYLAVGYQLRLLPGINGQFHEAILIKTDSEGLIVPDSTSNVLDVLDSGKIIINAYPNPTVSKLYINHNAQKKLTYQIINENGILIKKVTPLPLEQTFILDTDPFPTGKYFLNISDEKRNVLDNKLIFIN